MHIMQQIRFTYGTIILCLVGRSILGNPFEEEPSFSDENKFEVYDKFLMKPESDRKRSVVATPEINEVMEATTSIQKRQVGVVYKDDQPIGILQPYQRSYRFIPVKDENDFLYYGFNGYEKQTGPDNVPNTVDVEKREINGIKLDPVQLDESYPSILTTFKIVNKLDKKRNYDALTDENIENLKATIRRLRSSDAHHSNERVEDELKSILDDMGLIEDEEIHGKKRAITEHPIRDEGESPLENEIKLDKDKKREELCQTGVNAKATLEHNNFLNSDEKNTDLKNDDLDHTPFDQRESILQSNVLFRKKRQKQEGTGINNSNLDLAEKLKNSGDLMISGNKSPLASSSQFTEKKSDIDKRSSEEENDYEKRVERQIQSKINSLKEEVKREIGTLKNNQDDDEDEAIQKNKRAVDNLINEEKDELNPALHPSEGELKPLIRKRRNVGLNENINNFNLHLRTKRETSADKQKRTSNLYRGVQANEKHTEENEDGGELLGDDFIEGSIFKRQVLDNEFENIDHENFNSKSVNDLDPYINHLYNNYFYNNNRLKRQNFRGNDLFRNQATSSRNVPFRPMQWKSRFRRRIRDNQMNSNRPQQLSDMSDLDLFGALPKSYDGELSRYKRVKRK